MNPPSHPKTCRGFTLVEVVVTLALLLLLSAAASMYYRPAQDESINARVDSDLHLLRDQIRIYAQAHHGKLPAKLADVPLEPTSPEDPWGTPYYFTVIAPAHGGGAGMPVVGSCGPDRRPYGSAGPGGTANTADDDWVLAVSGGPVQRASAIAMAAASSPASTGTSSTTGP